MTHGNPGDDSQSTNERREAARQKSKALRARQRKKETRGRVVVQGGVILAALAVLAVVTLVIINSVKAPSVGPRNMLSDGILIGEGFVATPTAALESGSDPVPHAIDEESDVIRIQMYVDYFCVVCGAFEKTNGEQLSAWVESGAATVEIFPIALLDRSSLGTKYATRAANAAACVADMSPDQYYAFNTVLFDNQPEEGTAGLDDEELIDLTAEAGVTDASRIASCITEQRFKNWVADARTRAQNGPIPNSNVESVAGTPTVIVNGMKYTGALNDDTAFASFVIQAENSNYNERSTATPTPTPEPTETPAPEATPAP
jgi:hypothetical protein